MKGSELNGFVSRKVFTGTPVVVEYKLAEYAETLSGVLQALSEWGAKHTEIMRKTMNSRETFLKLSYFL